MRSACVASEAMLNSRDRMVSMNRSGLVASTRPLSQRSRSGFVTRIRREYSRDLPSTIISGTTSTYIPARELLASDDLRQPLVDLARTLLRRQATGRSTDEEERFVIQHHQRRH